MGRRGCSPHRRGAGGLRERGARPAPPGRRRLRRADCGERDGRRRERGERAAVIPSAADFRGWLERDGYPSRWTSFDYLF